MKLYQCKGRLKVVNMKKEMQNYTQNRELSWLKFNQHIRGFAGASFLCQ